MRPREHGTEEQDDGMQNLVETSLNVNSIQEQVATAQQPSVATQTFDHMGTAQGGAPQGTSYHLTQLVTHGQDQQQLINSTDGNENIDWSMTNGSMTNGSMTHDLFNDINPMINDQIENPFASISGDSASFASVLNDYSSTIGDFPLMDNDGQMPLEWNIFTNH